MRQLSPAGFQAINDVAQRHGFSSDAVQTMLEAVVNGNSSMAQFSHPEFGGSGQWMSGGMTMIGDMFNNHLKGRVDNLCAELARLVTQQPDLLQSDSLFVPQPTQPDWWGPDLRWPNSTGAQNGLRYAWFAQAHRLAIEFNGRVTVYDTLDHQIGGVSQQQSGGFSVTFTSQYGYVDLTQLPVVSVDGAAWAAAPSPAPVPPPPPAWASPAASDNTANVANGADNDIFASIEKLAQLHARGILTTDEFSAKKAELLGRL